MENHTTLKRALIIGATGFIGQKIVRILEQSDEIGEIHCFSRREISATSAKVHNHIVDFDNLDSSSDLFVGDMLFSCLGTTKAKAGSLAKQRNVDINYQLSAAKLAAKNGVRHYLLISSIGAHAQSLSPYLKMKGELEQHIAELNFPQTSIFRPSVLIGNRKEARLAETVGAKILKGLCLLPGLSKFSPVDGDDLAQEMVQEALAH